MPSIHPGHFNPFVRSWAKRQPLTDLLKVARALGYGKPDRGLMINWIVEEARRCKLAVKDLEALCGRSL